MVVAGELRDATDDAGERFACEGRLQDARQFAVPEVNEVVMLHPDGVASGQFLNHIRQRQQRLIDIASFSLPLRLGRVLRYLARAFTSRQIHQINSRHPNIFPTSLLVILFNLQSNFENRMASR